MLKPQQGIDGIYEWILWPFLGLETCYSMKIKWFWDTLGETDGLMAKLAYCSLFSSIVCQVWFMFMMNVILVCPWMYVCGISTVALNLTLGLARLGVIVHCYIVLCLSPKCAYA